MKVFNFIPKVVIAIINLVLNLFSTFVTGDLIYIWFVIFEMLVVRKANYSSDVYKSIKKNLVLVLLK